MVTDPAASRRVSISTLSDVSSDGADSQQNSLATRKPVRIYIDGIDNFPLNSSCCVRCVDPRSCSCDPALRENIEIHISEIEPGQSNRKPVGALPRKVVFSEGKQNAIGQIEFPRMSGRYVETAMPRTWSMRFEIYEGMSHPGSQPLAAAEIEAWDLYRKSEWQLLLSDPTTREATFGTPSGTDEMLRSPAFLNIRVWAPRHAAVSRVEHLARGSIDSETGEVRGIGVDAFEDRPLKRRVMIITRGTRGDVQPFVALARGLASCKDCEVIIVTELRWKKFVKDTGRPGLPGGSILFRPSGGDTMNTINEPLPRLVVQKGQHWVTVQALAFSRTEVEFFPSEGCVYHWARKEKPDFIVFGVTMSHIAMIVSEALGIPIVGFSLQPLKSIQPMNPNTAADEVLGEVRSVIGGQSFVTVLQQFMEKIPDVKHNIGSLNSLRRSRGLKPAPRHFDMANCHVEELIHQGVKIVVPINEYAAGLEFIQRLPSNYEFTDFIFLRQENDTVDEEICQFIAQARQAGRGVVAMTFSSMPVEVREILKVATNVCVNCKPCALEDEEDETTPAVVVLCSNQGLSKVAHELMDEVRRLQAEGRLLLWHGGVPFGALFPLLDAVVLHGGLGVTSEALVAGIPMITTGVLLMDQRYWATRVEQLGCGSEGVPIANFVRDPDHIVELLEKALDRRGPDVAKDASVETKTEISWREKAKEVRKKIVEDAGSDPQGILRNADAVFRLGTAEGSDGQRLAVICDAYEAEGGFLRTIVMQCRCLCDVFTRCISWVFCSQLPACFRLVLYCRWCVFCFVCIRNCCCRMAYGSEANVVTPARMQTGRSFANPGRSFAASARAPLRDAEEGKRHRDSGDADLVQLQEIVTHGTQQDTKCVRICDDKR